MIPELHGQRQILQRDPFFLISRYSKEILSTLLMKCLQYCHIMTSAKYLLPYTVHEHEHGEVAKPKIMISQFFTSL